jgi:hypothetical protein
MHAMTSAELPTRQLGSECRDLGDGRSDVRRAARGDLGREIAPVRLTVGQPDVLPFESLEFEEPEAVMELGW